MAISSTSASTSDWAWLKGGRRRWWPIGAVFLCLHAGAAWANLEETTWIFHGPEHDVRVPRRGGARGTPLVAVEDLARALNLSITLDYRRGELRLEHPPSGRKLSLKAGDKGVTGSSGRIELSRRVRLEPSAGSAKGPKPPPLFLVPLEFGDRLLRPLLTGEPARLPHPALVLPTAIVLDPGHGGNDWGATVVTAQGVLREKDLTLEIARELAEALKRLKVPVLLTRSEDTYLTLPERSKFANASRAALFVSIHLNSAPTKSRRGYEMYVLSLEGVEGEVRRAISSENQLIPEDHGEDVEKVLADIRAAANFEISLRAAKAFHVGLKGVLVPARSPIQAGPFYVLYGADMPALLWEVGFLSHEGEQEALTSAPGRQRWIEASARALAKARQEGIVRKP